MPASDLRPSALVTTRRYLRYGSQLDEYDQVVEQKSEERFGNFPFGASNGALDFPYSVDAHRPISLRLFALRVVHWSEQIGPPMPLLRRVPDVHVDE